MAEPRYIFMTGASWAAMGHVLSVMPVGVRMALEPYMATHTAWYGDLPTAAQEPVEQPNTGEQTDG